MQILELWRLAKFHAQIWQVRKMARILKTAARRAKISSILPPWGIKSVYVQLLELLQWQVGSQAERQGPWASCGRHFLVGLHHSCPPLYS